MSIAENWIENLNLQPHPEGGFFRENYRSTENIDTQHLPNRFQQPHCFGTAIYYLLQGSDFSAFHRIRQDETWHFYDGGALEIHVILPDGRHQLGQLGLDLSQNEIPQFTVPAGAWFGARLKNPHGFTLAGCTVAPGFEFTDFELAQRQELIRQFPSQKRLIEQLTRE